MFQRLEAILMQYVLNLDDQCYRSKDNRAGRFVLGRSPLALIRLLEPQDAAVSRHRFLPRPLETKAGIEEHLSSVFFVLRVRRAIKYDRVSFLARHKACSSRSTHEISSGWNLHEESFD